MNNTVQWYLIWVMTQFPIDKFWQKMLAKQGFFLIREWIFNGFKIKEKT